MSGTSNPYRHQYEVVPPSTTTQTLGGAGAVGDFLHRIVVNVTTTASSAFTVLDGSTGIFVNTGGVLANGVYNYEFNIASQNGAWKIAGVGSGVSIIGVGTFTN